MYQELIKLRQALEILSLDQVILKNFPYACCGNASNLVATYLEAQGYGGFEYVLGQNEEETKSHAWLFSLQSNSIVDLTADQFGFDEIVYISAENYPLLELFPKQENKGNASIFSGTNLDNVYYFTYKKLLDYLGN